jgi:hypothetical protein
MDIRNGLDRVGFSPKGGPEPATSIEHLENLVGVRLPAEYRIFLMTVGGGYLEDALASCTGLTPFGAEHIVTELHNVEEIIGLLGSTVAPRNMLCIGYGHSGMTTCLSIAGLDHGQVFSLDTEMKFYWDEETLSGLPTLAPAVREFFRLRDAEELPERPWGYDHCYHVADSFNEFLGKLRRAE